MVLNGKAEEKATAKCVKCHMTPVSPRRVLTLVTRVQRYIVYYACFMTEAEILKQNIKMFSERQIFYFPVGSANICFDFDVFFLSYYLS